MSEIFAVFLADEPPAEGRAIDPVTRDSIAVLGMAGPVDKAGAGANDADILG